MSILKFVLDSRGPANLTKRTFQILTRFGIKPEKMGGRFERFMDVLDEYDCRPTFPITALPMSRNPKFAHRLLDRGAELAVHAWSHIDLTTLSLEGQSDHMGKAIQLFREHGVPFTGFRAPYLHWNEDTMQVVEQYRYRYDSNEIVMWDVLDEDALTPQQKEGLEKGRNFYQPHVAETRSVLPFIRRGFVEIPVSLPDDEILLDRMYTHDADFLGQVWRRILDKTYARGELFTVQLHPERIDFFRNALGGLLAECRRRKPGVWIATLDEIARWWRDKTQNRAEFVRDGDGFKVRIKTCKGASVYLREAGVEKIVAQGEFRIAGDKRPTVGVEPGSSSDAIGALQDRGFVVEVGTTDEFVLHLGRIEMRDYDQLQDMLKRIDACKGPLLYFGTWPHGNRSALAVTGDIDALTLWDFVSRFRGA